LIAQQRPALTHTDWPDGFSRASSGGKNLGFHEPASCGGARQRRASSVIRSIIDCTPPGTIVRGGAPGGARHEHSGAHLKRHSAFVFD